MRVALVSTSVAMTAALGSAAPEASSTVPVMALDVRSAQSAAAINCG